MPGTFKCSLVTPEKLLFEADVIYAGLPAQDGYIGIQRQRAPLLAGLGNGHMDVRLADGTSKRFSLEGGFAQMRGNVLTVLSDKVKES